LLAALWPDFAATKALDLVAIGGNKSGVSGRQRRTIWERFEMRAMPVAAALLLGMTLSASAQWPGLGGGAPVGPGMGPGPGMGAPGGGGFGAPPQQQQQQQAPPCYSDFTPLRQEAEKRANLLKAGMQRKPPREEACALIKNFSAAESKVVRFVTANAQKCGIPTQAVTTMKTNHERTAKMQTQVCEGGGAGPAKPTGPGLSEALGTSRGNTLDPLAPQSGGLDTLTGNVLSR
jgi:hypothetical protein